MLYRVLMPSAPPSDPDEWHAALEVRDSAVHHDVLGESLAAENAALRTRLDGLIAELRVARAAVVVRDAVLHQQSLALAQRDADLAEMAAAAPRHEPRDLSTLVPRVKGLGGRGARVAERGLRRLRRGRA